MKSPLRGRVLEVPLRLGCELAALRLVDLGFTPDRADDVAEAALKFAEEETSLFVRQLTPRSAWPGSVIVRRHVSAQREETWLMLKLDSEIGWKLDSALFV